MGADVVGFNWEGKGAEAIAVVKLRLNLRELEEMLGEKIVGVQGEFVEAEGRAAQSEMTSRPGSDEGGGNAKAATIPKIPEGNIDVMP